MPLFTNQDPVQLYIQGRITEEKLQKKLKRMIRQTAGSIRLPRLSSDSPAVFDTAVWCQFLIDINEQRHPIPVSLETKKMIISCLDDSLLIDLATKARGNDYINALAIFEMREQDSLRRVLQYFHRFSPFRRFIWQDEKLMYTEHPVGAAYERGGLSVWAILQRIEQKHFRSAWYNCDCESAWVKQLREKKVEGRYFSGQGMSGWGDKPAMSYMELLPDVEHRIIIAESGVEMKRPGYMRE